MTNRAKLSQKQGFHRFGFYLSIPSIFITLSFLDPINWPKNLLLALFSPILVWTALRNMRITFLKMLSMESSKIFLFTFLLIVIPALFTFDNLTRFLWGTWGRNNGIVTNLCLIVVAMTVASQARIPGFATYLLNWIQFFSLAAGVYGYMQIFGLDPVDWSSQNQIFSFFGNTNFASAIFAMGTITSVLLFRIEKENSQRRTLSICSAALLGYLTFATGSLQGLVAIGLAVVLILFLEVRERSGKLAIAYFAVAAISGLVTFAGFAGYGPLGDSIRQYTISLRFQYWLVGIEMGLKHPIFGVGVDSYGDFYREYRPVELIRQTTLDLTTNNAHNSLIQVFATLGLLGLIGVLLPLLLALKAAVFSFFKGKNDEWSAITVLFFSLWSMSLISIDNIAIAIWNWVTLGALVGKHYIDSNKNQILTIDSLEKKRSPNSIFSIYDSQKVVALSLSAIVFAFTWNQSQPERTLLSTKRIFVPENDQNGPIVEKRKSFQLLRNTPNLMERHFFELGLEQNATGDWPYTIELMNKAINNYPNDFYLFDLKAVTQENNGLLNDAISTRIAQLKLDPNHVVVMLNLTKDLVKLGRNDEAKFYLESMKRVREFLSPEGVKEAQELAKTLGSSF